MTDFIWIFRGFVKRVIDGDTIVVDLDLGLDIILKDQYIRLAGLNTPETRGREKVLGKIAKNFVIDKLPIGREIAVLSEKYDPRGKYGRIVGTVGYLQGGISINSQLINEGYALPYDGKGPIPRFDVNAEYPLKKNE